MDGGTQKGSSEVKKGLGSVVQLHNIMVLGREEGLQKRRDFTKKRQSDADAAKRRKVLSAGDLSSINGRCENLYFGKKGGPVPSREHKFCSSPGMESSASPAIMVPLFDPSELHMIPCHQKDKVLPQVVHLKDKVLFDEKPEARQPVHCLTCAKGLRCCLVCKVSFMCVCVCNKLFGVSYFSIFLLFWCR